ncbi:MAG: Uma2 family endonuclease [Lewinella sp.]|nr:Uma2 family endonuclease [Lewinella sp.]
MQESMNEKISMETYLAREEQAEYKSEYERGRVRAMRGGSVNHGIIGNNVNGELRTAIGDKNLDYVAINSEVRVFIEAADAYVYPDGMVICGEVETAAQDEHSVVNPILVVEVLSKSTGSRDRGDKFHMYCSLPAFREYVLIDQYKPVVDVLYREEPTCWKMVTTIGLDKSVYLQTLDVSIPMADIYRKVSGLQAPL